MEAESVEVTVVAKPQNNKKTYASVLNSSSEIILRKAGTVVAKSQTNKKTYTSVPNSSSEVILRKAGTVVAKPQTNKKTYTSVPNSSSEIILRKAGTVVAKPQTNKKTYASVPNSSSEVILRKAGTVVAKPQTNKKTNASVPNSSSEVILRKAGTVVAKPQTNKKTYASVLNSSNEITLTKAVMVVAKPQSNKTTYEETQRSQWSNLSNDLLNMIIKKLCFSDRIRFHAICKDWQISTGDQPVNELPWVMTHTCFYDWGVPAEEIRVMLSDPVHKKTHTIANFAGIRDEYINCFIGSSIQASKRGWLLLANKMRGTEISIFLYSPFTNKVIMLPTFFALIPDHGLATFSSNDPKVPECVFIAAHYCTHRELGISTYRNGDSNWRTKIIDANFCSSVDSLECTENGVCFFVLGCGKLGFLCVESQVWGWLVDSVWIMGDWTPRYDMHLVEFNGDLFLARYCFVSDRCEIFRYDENKRDWVEQKSLGDRVLFIGFSSYLRPAIGDTADLADMVFYICNCFVSRIRVYSLKDGKWYNKRRAYDCMVEEPLETVLIEPPC